MMHFYKEFSALPGAETCVNTALGCSAPVLEIYDSMDKFNIPKPSKQSWVHSKIWICHSLRWLQVSWKATKWMMLSWKTSPASVFPRLRSTGLENWFLPMITIHSFQLYSSPIQYKSKTLPWILAVTIGLRTIAARVSPHWGGALTRSHQLFPPMLIIPLFSTPLPQFPSQKKHNCPNHFFILTII